MRIARPSQFAMVPTWVIQNPAMKGFATRIAVYVGLRVLAFEHPNRDWASERELADEIEGICGVGAEACRKHLRAMRIAGVIAGDAGEILLPCDPPIGDVHPHNGDTGTQGGDTRPQTPLTKKERSDSSALEVEVAAFYASYPRKKVPGAARRAYAFARKKVSAEIINAALGEHKSSWLQLGTPLDKIPYPATWLNGESWASEIEVVVPSAPGSLPPQILPALVSEWLTTRIDPSDGIREGLADAWRAAHYKGYGTYELAARLAILCRIQRQRGQWAVDTWCLTRIGNVQRFGSLPDWIPDLLTLMDKAYEKGSW